MADLQELYSRLRASTESTQSSAPGQSQSQASIWSTANSQQPTNTPPLFSPPTHPARAANPFNIASPVIPASPGGAPALDANRAGLLKLLKFNGQAAQPRSASGPMANLQNVAPPARNASMQHPIFQSHDFPESRPLSGIDLMASLHQKPATPSIFPAPSAPPETDQPEAQATQAGSQQQSFLLDLLKKPATQQPVAKPVAQPESSVVASAEKHEAASETAAKPQAQRESTPIRQFGSPAPSSSISFEAPESTKASLFAYTNPFDQLHSSSPLNRNRTPKPEAAPEPKKKIEILKHSREVSSLHEEATAPAAKNRKLESADTVSAAAQEGDTKVQSVSEALGDVGEAVDKQVERALAQADAGMSDKPPAYEEVTIKKEPVGDIESSWESAEDDAAKHSDGYKVEIYNFPMTPFVSLQIKNLKPARPIRQDAFTNIAKMKKDFDQVDRCLATASQTYIAFASLATKKDNAGLKIIRQDNAKTKQIFGSCGERFFNVQLCSSHVAGNDVETVLGTGVGGSVIWTSLAISRGDLFQDDDVEAQGFVMPPVATAEENTSGSPVKTRAKVSSRHPEFFAIARGKQIFIVSPDTVKDPAYCHPTTRQVDSEKYFADHTLKINTGKAGKDFCFSEDDSMIVSLDKNGRIKFWDIRDLINRASGAAEGKHEPVELRDPIWTLNASTSGSKVDQKPSVSSIMFLDKDKPVAKGLALRYMIVGFRQNHILQLWDLGLGKAVQEIRLPHDKDSDPICSIGYHPKSGIVAIGHPTRNSVFFVHLSAPKYNIPQLDQARYISMLSRNDSNLRKPDSTAIMSGLREISFANVGDIRSVDMLRTPVENGSERNTAEETLFELYIMHSRGVVDVPVKREDLGWDDKGKMLNPKSAEKEGVVEITELIPAAKLPVSSSQSSNADISKPAKPAVNKKVEPSKPAEIKKEVPQAAASAKASNGPYGAVASGPSPAKAPAPTKAPAQSAAPKPTAPTTPCTANGPGDKVAQDAAPVAAQTVSEKPAAAQVQSVGADEAKSTVSKEFESLYQRLDGDKRVQEAAAGAKQDALLRLVSSTLTENVDRSLSAIIAKRIEKDVVPALTDITDKAIDRKLAELLPQQLANAITSALKTTLPSALHEALKNPVVNQTISNITANQVGAKVQQQVSALLQQALPDMASQATHQMISDLETRTNEKFRHAEKQRQQDHAKIEELSSLVRSLSTTIQAMSDSQSAYQEQILKMQRETKSALDSAKSAASTVHAPEPQEETEDAKIAAMTQQLVNGQFEEATIQWISSDRQAEFFDKLFVRLDPAYLRQLSPLVALTVSAAVTSSFNTFVGERLDWLSRVLNQIDIHEAEIMDVAPKIMDVLASRLQAAFMMIADANGNDPVLRTVMNLNRQVNDIRRL